MPNRLSYPTRVLAPAICLLIAIGLVLPAVQASRSGQAQISIDSTVTPALPSGPPTKWLPRGPGGGGALFAPSFSPFNSNELYISCDMSEVFHTTNLGATWDLYDFRQIQGNRESQMRFTNNPLIIFSIDYTDDAATPTKSTDAGLTWHRLSADPTSGETYTVFTDPNSSTRLIVSDYSNIYLSTDGGNTFASKFSTASGSGCFVGGAFFDGNNIYAGTNQGLLTSSNNGNFTAGAGGIPATESIVSFAGAKQGATIRFFCVTLNSGDVFPGLFTEGSYFGYLGVYSLDVGQPNWTKRVTGINAQDFPIFVATSRTSINTAYLAGQNSSEFPIVYKTTDGGGSWTSVLLTNNNQNIYTGWAGRGGDRDWSYGAGALGFAVSPLDSNKLAFTDLGFSHLSTDGGTTWKQMYVSPVDQNPLNTLIPKGRAYHSVGLEDTTCWWVTWKDANTMFASYSDIKGTRSTDGGASWSFNYAGQPYNSTYQSVKHPTTGTLYAATSSVHDMYQSTRLQDSILDAGNGAIKFSTDGGANWLTLHDFVHPVICLALDPNNSNKMYASVIHSTQGGIFVSTNIQNGATSTWTKLANPPRTEGHPFNIRVLNDGMVVCTYSGRRNAAGAFTASSGVFTSTDGGNTWTDRSASGMMYWTKDLVIDSFDSTQNTWYVGVFSGWGGPPNGLGGLYKTTNRGVSWTRINSLDRVTSCAISPANANEMYVTTETNGLWYTNNLNSGSPTFSAVTSYPFRQPERVFFNPNDSSEIWVTSFGNGLRVGGGNPCGFSLSSSSIVIPYTGWQGSFVVSAANGCGWTVTSNVPWIMVRSVSSGVGQDTVNYEVRENFTGAARSGTITAAGLNFTIVQSADSGCSFLLSPATFGISSAGGLGWFNVVTGPACGWSATSSPSWVSINSATLGIGTTAITFTIAPNATGVSRKGKISVGGQVFTIKQGK